MAYDPSTEVLGYYHSSAFADSLSLSNGRIHSSYLFHTGNRIRDGFAAE